MPDYFTTLGLTPGSYNPDEIRSQFEARRAEILDQLHDPATHRRARERLDVLHLAHQMLRHPGRQASYLRALQDECEPATDALRRLVASSLEDGLLRYSRRKQILEFARAHGIHDFQAQLIIAQVQFGQSPLDTEPAPVSNTARLRVGASLAAATFLAAAMFVMMSVWLRV